MFRTTTTQEMDHMKRLLLSSVALAGLTVGAMAADLPSRRAPAPFVAVPVFTWTGFYVGVNAGYGFSDRNNFGTINLPAGSVVNSAGTNGVLTLNNAGRGNRDGFIGGGQVGYNYQIGSFVVGLEADAQYIDFGRPNRAATYTFAGATGIAFAPPAATLQFRNNDEDFFGTVRGRLGFAMDRVLIYATGGLSYTTNDFGWTAGGGVEYAFTPSLSAKVEGLYVSLDRNQGVNAVYTGVATNTVILNASRGGQEFGVVRAGLNYRFNSFLGL